MSESQWKTRTPVGGSPDAADKLQAETDENDATS
jgi:hypothetical protein